VTSGSKKRSAPPRFVVQRHDATNLHFDLRLEIDGVLVSWAVPKGPSLDPADKRLAHKVGDHQLDYIDFEGRIEGSYGKGTVVVWDIGPYENITQKKGQPVSAADAIRNGHIKVVLLGEKLRGAFALTHTKMGGDEANWMLVKVDDEFVDRRRKPTSTQNESVLSGKTNEDFEDR
jgi:DNA ligase D-like protein (predicted 3'-phosphoesterase)